MDPVTAIIVAIIGGLGLWLLKQTASGIFKIIINYTKGTSQRLVGKRFAVMGPAESGKSSFIDYIINDHFVDTNPSLVEKTVKVKYLPPILIDKGGDLVLETSGGADLPGEYLPRDQVNELVNGKYAGIILILDAQNQNHCTKWIQEFGAELASAFTRSEQLKVNLKTIIVVTNKIDKTKKKNVNQSLENAKTHLQESLGGILKHNINKVRYRPCTLFKSKGGRKYANRILLDLIEQLASKQTLYPE